MHGREEIRRYWGTLRETWDGLRIDPLEGFDVGEGRVVIDQRMWAKGTRSGIGIDKRSRCSTRSSPSTGRSSPTSAPRSCSGPSLSGRARRLRSCYVASRVVESIIIVVGLVSLLSVVTLRGDFAGVGVDAGTLTTAGESLVAIHDWTFLLGPGFCVGVNGLLLGYLFYRSGLVPRAIGHRARSRRLSDRALRDAGGTRLGLQRERGIASEVAGEWVVQVAARLGRMVDEAHRQVAHDPELRRHMVVLPDAELARLGSGADRLKGVAKREVGAGGLLAGRRHRRRRP